MQVERELEDIKQLTWTRGMVIFKHRRVACEWALPDLPDQRPGPKAVLTTWVLSGAVAKYVPESAP